MIKYGKKFVNIIIGNLLRVSKNRVFLNRVSKNIKKNKKNKTYYLKKIK